MNVTEHLLREHNAILRVVDRLSEALSPFDAETARECLEFFVQFVDRVHYRQEEHVLFAELMHHAPEVFRSSVQNMQKEHNLSRAFLRAALGGLGDDPPDRLRAHAALENLVRVMREHIVTENDLLFPMVAVSLPPSRDPELLEEMHQARREVMSDEVYAEHMGYSESGRRGSTLVVRKRRPQATVRPEETDQLAQPDDVFSEEGAEEPPTLDVPRRVAGRLDARTLTEDGEPDRLPDTAISARAGRVLFDDGDGHRDVWLHDFGRGLLVQANQFLIIDGGEGMVLDPGGPKVYADVFAETTLHLGEGQLKYVFLSHQDPDIGTSLNAWLMDTEARALVSRLWMRFLPHFGIDRLISERMDPVPDEGAVIQLGGRELVLLPAHFLHSCGNLQVYDPTSKILFSGDLGAAISVDYSVVTDFDAHARAMERFHTRYIPSRRALQYWVDMVRDLDIEIIAPQHGAMFEGRDMVHRFLQWCEDLECGLDLMKPTYRVPQRD